MQLTVTLVEPIATATSVSCVSVPGWAVITVAALLTAPRLVDELLPRQSG